MRNFSMLRFVYLGLVASSSLVLGFHNQYIANYKQRLQQLELGELGSYLSNRQQGPKDWNAAPIVDVDGNTIPPYDTIYMFDQLIDHNNPNLGTFKQRYYHSWEYYQPGGPIVILTPGETQLDTPGRELFLTNITIPGAIAQSVKGAGVIIEHRYFGESNPYPDLTTENFKLHTIEQAIEDFAYFARTAKLAMPGGDGEGIRPDRTPWIFVGGSYSGALAAWIVEQRPNEFWASYATSAVVQPQLDFHQYYDPIQKYMPANCSADMRKIINFVDSTIDSGNQTRISELSSQFGLADFGPSDLGNALSLLLDLWQSLDIASSRGSLFYEFCDAMEVRGHRFGGKNGWGLDIALDSLTNYVSGPSGFWATYCESAGAPSIHDCLALDGTVVAQNTTINNWYRSWTWIVCNEVGWWQVGPVNGSGIVSKYYDLTSAAKYCVDAFPGAFPDPSVAAYQARVDSTMKKYKGWKTFAHHVFVVNGQRDPWLDVTLSATSLPPNGPGAVVSDEDRPIYLTDGFHVSDVRASNAAVDSSIANVWKGALGVFPQWVEEFHPSQSL